MKTNRFQLLLLLIITFFIGYYFGVNKVKFDWQNYRPQIQVSSKEPPAVVSAVDFSQFWTVWQKLQEDYYDKSKLEPQKMLNGAIEGMVQSLGDPFTIYLPSVQNDNFKKGLAGQFSGIGAELGIKDKNIIVIAPLDGTPAQKMGIKAGDIILEVDGEDTIGWPLSQAVDKIRGPKDTFVTLTVLHKNDNKPTEIKIKRDTITVKSVSGWVKKIKEIEGIKSTKSIKGNEDDSIAYIRLSQFGDSTNKDWSVLIDKLNSQIQKEENLPARLDSAKRAGRQDFKGIILDLRNNPGGYLTDAVFIASEFLRKGQTVVLEETGSFERRSLNVLRDGKFLDVSVVVLINKGSASASEIVAGALKDHSRAKLVGETSFGKGTIQKAEDLGNGAGIHVTVAKWLTPNGIWINSTGLTPDITVVLDSKDQAHDTQLEKAIEELIK